jgi:hypothetical protein
MLLDIIEYRIKYDNYKMETKHREVILQVNSSFESSRSVQILDAEHQAKMVPLGQHILEISDSLLIHVLHDSVDPNECWIKIHTAENKQCEFERRLVLRCFQEEIVIYLRVGQNQPKQAMDILSFTISWQRGVQVGPDGNHYPYVNYIGWNQGSDYLTIKQLRTNSNSLLHEKVEVQRGVFAFGNIFTFPEDFSSIRAGDSKGGYKIFYGWESTRNGEPLFDYWVKKIIEGVGVILGNEDYKLEWIKG